MTAYGVEWDSSAGTTALTRTEGNVGKTAGAAFDTIAPWGSMERCNLWTDGTKTTSYGDTCFTDVNVSTMGQCMVRIPKFFYSVDITGDPHICFYISELGTEVIANHSGGGNITWAAHPVFYVGGAAKTYAYIGAFEAYKNGSYLESKAGVAPATGDTMATYRTAARLRGTGWNLMTIQAWAAIQLLYMIEYANLNSQTTLGYGYVHNTNTEPMNTGATGTTGTDQGNDSYGVTGDTDHAMSFRGIENVWGNVETFLEGLNIGYDAAGVQNYSPAIAPQARTVPTYYTAPAATVAPYDLTTIMLNASNYLSGVDFTDADYKWSFLPSAGAGSTSTYFCDYYTAAVAGYARVGGYYSSSSIAGIFSFVIGAITNFGTGMGVRIQYFPST